MMAEYSNMDLKTYTLNLKNKGNSAYICLKGNPFDQDGKICLTHECVSKGELDYEIDRLRRELDAVEAAGNTFFDWAKKNPESLITSP
jgi:hypothetical protein